MIDGFGHHKMDKYRITHNTLRILRLYALDYRLRLHVREAGRRIGADMTAARLHLGRLEGIGILRDSDRDRWFSATEARDYGMLDKVIVRRGEML